MNKTNVSDVISAIDKLIAGNYLIVNHEKNVATCDENLFNSFDTDEMKHTFIRNLQLYCDLKNAYNGKDKCNDTLNVVVKNTSVGAVAVWQFDRKKIYFKDLHSRNKN